MNKQNKILVIRFSSLGDVAMTVPVLHELVKQNPNAELYVLSTPMVEPLFSGIPRCTFVAADLKKEYKGLVGLFRLFLFLKSFQFDAIADLHNVLRTKIIKFFFRLWRGTSIRIYTLDKGRKEKKAMTRKKQKVLHPLPNNTERYANVFRRMGIQLFLPHQLKDHLNLPTAVDEAAIGIAPFAKHEQKILNPQILKSIAKTISEMGIKVYLFGGKAEARELESWEVNLNILSLAGKYSMEEELKIIKGLRFMVSMDSANMHLASLVGTRVISVWGATHPYLGFLGYGQSNRDAFQHQNLDCRPCSVYGNKKCWRGDWACVNELDEGKLLHKCLQALELAGK